MKFFVCRVSCLLSDMFALVMLAQRGKRSQKQTLQRIVLPPLQAQLQQLVSHVRLVLSIGFLKLWRCNNLLMVGVLAARNDRSVRRLPVLACLLSDMFNSSPQLCVGFLFLILYPGLLLLRLPPPLFTHTHTRNFVTLHIQ